MAKLIYLADDEENIRVLMKAFLENEGYAVMVFPDGSSIRQAFERQIPDLIILDIMMPGEDGLSVCSYIRSRSNVPIIIVSAKDTPLDHVAGITMGSDDYISKPFLPLELAARVKALFRRSEMSSREDAEAFFCGNMILRPASRNVCIGRGILNVTPTEYEFLFYLIKRAGMAVSKKEILKEVWGYPDTSDSRMVDDLVKRLRKSFGRRDRRPVWKRCGDTDTV